MRKARTLIVLAAMFAATMVLLPSSHAASGASVADASNDAISRLNNYRGAYEEDRPYTPVLDLTSAGLSAAGGIITLDASFAGNLPVPGADVTGPNGFPAGVSAITIDWAWAMDDSTGSTSTMAHRNQTGWVCGDKYTEETAAGNTIVRIDQNETDACRPTTDGPYHPSDGWNFQISLQAGDDGTGHVFYSWNFGRYDALEAITWTSPGSDNDLVECSDINPGTAATPCAATGGNGVFPNATPSTLNGARYNVNTGALAAGTAWPGGLAPNQVRLTIPYKIRSDFSDNDNGTTLDDPFSYTAMAPGDVVTGFTTYVGGTVAIDIPPEPLCYGALIPSSLTQDHNGPLPVNSSDCFSYSASNTFLADWAPGNPFVNRAAEISSGPASAAVGGLCLNGACQPNWGGYIIGTGIPTSPLGSYTPGTNAPFCRYPAGLVAGAGAVPSGLTTRTLDDPLGGGTIKLANGSLSAPYPAVPHDGPDIGQADGPGVTVVFPGTGSDQKCGNQADPNSSNWILTGTGTGFIAG